MPLNRLLYVSLLAAAGAAQLFADTVEMKPEGDDTTKEGLKLEGKVHKEYEDYIIFLVDNDKGKVRIPKNKIKNIEYDINTQTEKLKPDDYAGRYRVGQWAMDRAMYAEAIEIFEKLKGQEGPGPDMQKLLAQAYEKRQQLDKALENYSDYARLHPDDAAIAAKVKELNDIVNPEVKVATPDKNKPKIVDGLEGDGTWVAENWGNPAKVQFSVDPLTANKTIAVQSEGGAKDKIAVSRTGQPLDLSESHEMILRVNHNGDQAVNMAFAFINAQGEFHETKHMRVPPGSWTNLSIRIDGKNFKANRNNFKDYDLEIDGKGNIKRIAFLIYSQKPILLYMDAIFFK
jgi:tetratricopeptide (TPR) repeat protein